MPCGDTFLALVKSRLVLALGEKGEVRYKEYGLSADHAAGLRVARGAPSLTIELPAGHPGATVSVIAPGDWVLENPAADVRMTAEVKGHLVLTLPKDVAKVVLKRR